MGKNVKIRGPSGKTPISENTVKENFNEIMVGKVVIGYLMEVLGESAPINAEIGKWLKYDYTGCADISLPDLPQYINAEAGQIIPDTLRFELAEVPADFTMSVELPQPIIARIFNEVSQISSSLIYGAVDFYRTMREQHPQEFRVIEQLRPDVDFSALRFEQGNKTIYLDSKFPTRMAPRITLINIALMNDIIQEVQRAQHERDAEGTERLTQVEISDISRNLEAKYRRHSDK